MQEKTFILCPKCPWYTDRLRHEKQLRQQYERKWRSSGLETDRRHYKHQCNIISGLIAEKKSKYYCDKVTQACHDQKKLFKVFDSLMQHNTDKKLPHYNNSNEICEIFSTFSQRKSAEYVLGSSKHLC